MRGVAIPPGLKMLIGSPTGKDRATGIHITCGGLKQGMSFSNGFPPRAMRCPKLKVIIKGPDVRVHLLSLSLSYVTTLPISAGTAKTSTPKATSLMSPIA